MATQKARALLLLSLKIVAGITIHSSVRSDSWLPQYPVGGASAPTTGRRVQIVVGDVNISDTNVQSVRIDGYECTDLPVADDADLSRFDWCRAHANAKTGQLWISFHTRNDTWVSGAPLSVVTAAAGSLTVSPMRLPLLVSHVTTVNRGAQAVIHVHSAHTGTASIVALLFDGKPVLPNNEQIVVRFCSVFFLRVKLLSLASAFAAHARQVPAGGHALFVVDLAQPKQTGDVWTAVLFTGTDQGAAYGGRVIPERFPVQATPTHLRRHAHSYGYLQLPKVLGVHKGVLGSGQVRAGLCRFGQNQLTVRSQVGDMVPTHCGVHRRAQTALRESTPTRALCACSPTQPASSNHVQYSGS